MATDSEDRGAVTRDTLAKFGQEAMPNCHCFSSDEQGIQEQGLRIVGGAMDLGHQVAAALGSVGTCPSAMPRMMAILVHTAVFELACTRATIEGGDTSNPYTLVDAMEHVHDDISRALAHLRSRPREIFRREAN